VKIQVSGTLSFSGSPCFSNGDVAGSLSGDQLSASITAGRIQITIDAVVTSSQMSGTYDVVSAGACTGDNGTFTATR
jgi:hypothetical protein